MREFVHLLNYTDEQEKLTGDPGADFRQEAYTYIAGSLDNFDFVGPGPGGALHRAARHPRDGQEPRRGRDEAPHRDRPGPGRAAHPAGQAVDNRDLQGARARVPHDQPVQERARHLPDDARQVADGPLGSGHAERDRRGVRAARPADQGRRRAARLRSQGPRGADGPREVHRRHAVGRREQGQPGRAPARRGARAHGPQGGGHHAHAQRPGGSRAGRSDERRQGEAAAHDLRASRSTSSRRSAGSGT